MNWLTLTLTTINAGLSIAGTTGLIPAPVTALILALEPVVAGAIDRIQSGQGKVSDVVTALGAMSAALEIISKQNNLDPKVLAAIQTWTTAVQAGMAGYLDAKNGIDLSKLDPIAPIV